MALGHERLDVYRLAITYVAIVPDPDSDSDMDETKPLTLHSGAKTPD